MKQIMRRVCMACRLVVGCYSSEREVKTADCSSCEGLDCPTPTQDDSDGLCLECAKKYYPKLADRLQGIA